MNRKPLVFFIYILFLVAASVEGSFGNCYAQSQADSRAIRKYDEFVNVNCEVELARMDSLLSGMGNNPESVAHIIVYGGQEGRHYEALSYAARMRFYATHTRRMDSRRIITIDGGYRENLTTEFWLGPRGQPMPTPTPTVNSKDVRLKGRATLRGRDCGSNMN